MKQSKDKRYRKTWLKLERDEQVGCLNREKLTIQKEG